MVVVGGESEKANVSGKDLAAALAPERGRAPVLNKDIAALKERYVKDMGKSVFEADLAQNPEDLMVNFDEMHRVLDSERKRVDSETDTKKKDVLQKRYNRLELRFNIYDKLLNNEGLNAMDSSEQRELINTMAALPGFAEATAIAIGGRLSTDQVMNVLTGKGGVAVTPDEKKTLSEMIVSMANDDKFKNRLSKKLSTLSLDGEDSVKSQELADLRDTVKDETAKRTLQTTHKATIDAFEGRPETEIARINKVGKDTDRYYATISEGNKPTNLSLPEITTKETDLIALVASATAAHAAAAASPAGGAGEHARLTQLQTELAAVRSLKAIYTVGTAASDYSAYEKVADARTKKAIVDGELKTIDKNKGTIAKLEGERSKYADKYKRQMEVALSEEMKRYWNEVTLTNASKAAEAQASIAEEAKVEEQKEKDLRVSKTKEMLDRFMQLSYLKYENGEAKGWDDAAIKQFAKKDIFSRSPKQISRDIVDRIIRSKSRLPRAYGKEIDAMLKEMGVGKGEPPLAARDVLNSIDSTHYEKWAEEKMPDLMGYAWARGYYFDRMKIKPAQAEFLQRAYKEDFFANALAAKGQYAEEAATLMGGEFMSGGAVTKEKIKEMLGKDWVGGSKKLMKLLAYAGAGYAMAGGLVFQGGNYVGLQHVGNSIRNILGAGAATAQAVSRAGDWAINAPTEALSHTLNGQLPMVDAATGTLATDAAGNVVQPGIKPFIPVKGAPYPDILYPKK